MGAGGRGEVRAGERVGAGVGNSPGLGAKLPQANVSSSNVMAMLRTRMRSATDLRGVDGWLMLPGNHKGNRQLRCVGEAERPSLQT